MAYGEPLLFLSILLSIQLPSVLCNNGNEGELTEIGERFRGEILSTFEFYPEAELVFVIDSSGSVDESDFDLAIEFIGKISTLLKVSSTTTRVTVISFSRLRHEVHPYIDYISKSGGEEQVHLSEGVGRWCGAVYGVEEPAPSKACDQARSILTSQGRPHALR